MAKKVPGVNIIPGGKLNNFLNNFPEKLTGLKSSKKFYLVLLVVGILLLVIYKKSWFVAAMVNGIPITNLELQTKLNQQFRAQTLNQLINEKIILNEVTKNNALAKDEEVSKKISEIEKSVGGAEAFNTLLSQQGQSRDSIKEQIRLQLSIEKLYGKEATVSAQEVEQFVAQNSAQLQATDSAKQRQEAENLLKQQKLSQIFNQKFTSLRSQAKIQIF